MNLGKAILAVFTWTVIAFLIYIPLILVIIFSFNDSIYFIFPLKGFTLKWYLRVFEDPGFLKSVINSIVVALATTAGAILIGVPASFSFVRLRRNNTFAAFIVIPFIVPWLVIGVSCLIFFYAIGIPLSLLTVTLSHIIYSIPLVVLIVAARLISLNPNYEKASMDLGADQVQTFINVTLPLIYPSIAISALITFLWSFDNFIVTFFTIGSDMTVPLWIWGSLRRPVNVPVIAAASSIIIIIGSLIVYFIEEYRLRRGETITLL
ncbi:MAG: ABC transporter permease [Nitrososphaeria archaeon]|nr:ABC transporter permease [Nitrososphaeria archaeon]